MVAIAGVLTGILLGTRYKVLCLVPVMMAGAAFLVVAGRLNDVSAGTTALSALALGIALQIGYLVGFGAQSMLSYASTRKSPHRSRALVR